MAFATSNGFFFIFFNFSNLPTKIVAELEPKSIAQDWNSSALCYIIWLLSLLQYFPILAAHAPISGRLWKIQAYGPRVPAL